MRKTTLCVFREKGNFFHEGDAIAPNAPNAKIFCKLQSTLLQFLQWIVTNYFNPFNALCLLILGLYTLKG